ncbi:MAG: choice-of-anchor B family protein [Flavobacteriaceae bacterium]|nr:choice-of-anchor B family protein [Flavobacteriaceae bacterium]
MKRISLLLACILLCISCSNDDGPDVVVEPGDNNSGNNNNNNNNGEDTNFQACENGMAGIYPCDGFDLLARIPLSEFGSQSANDIWGWTDPMTSKEYALVGLNDGTAFVDISDTENLVYLGKLSTATSSSAWRDIKVYNDHAFVVAEAGGHGMQVFDLTQLRDVVNPPVIFTADANFSGFGNAHNIVINEDSGYAYAVGTARNDAYFGGAHFVNIQDPLNPTADGGLAINGYTHDANVITYNGPDAEHVGKEIYVGANENNVAVVDVSDKSNPSNLSVINYSNTAYTHQGWFTEDHKYLIVGDELDEINFLFNSRTLIFDMTDMDNPVLHTTYLGPTSAIDHNGYVKGNAFFLSNYTAGMRVLDISAIDSQTIMETGFFDTYPINNVAEFSGVWSIYPYFSSGKIVVNDINSGLFIVQSSN